MKTLMNPLSRNGYRFVRFVNFFLLMGVMSMCLMPRLTRAETLITPQLIEKPVGGGWSSGKPEISGDGRYVAFWLGTPNLVVNTFVFDRLTGTKKLIATTPPGHAASVPSISGDGRYVAFQSAADNLVPGDTNGKRDIFVYDQVTQAMERVSVSSTGVQANEDSSIPTISPDGRFVAFSSVATNLVAGNTNIDKQDVFVHDRLTRTTERVSVSSAGVEGNASSSLSDLTKSSVARSRGCLKNKQ